MRKIFFRQFPNIISQRYPHFLKNSLISLNIFLPLIFLIPNRQKLMIINSQNTQINTFHLLNILPIFLPLQLL